MLAGIDKNALTIAILNSYDYQTETSAKNLSEKYINNIDPLFENCVQCWIDKKPIPDISVGKYSVKKVLSIRNSTDYLTAFELLSIYKNDPEKGEKQIWEPIKYRPN